jgi:repressor LexA
MDDSMTMTVYDEAKKYIDENKLPPTLHDLCERTGLKSTSNVRYHLLKLEQMGMLRRIPRTARGIVLVDVS